MHLGNEVPHDDEVCASNGWPLVSVLFITYKRVDLLEKAVSTFIKATDYPNLELIVADDGSPPEVQEKLSSLPVDYVLLSPENRGLGANINRGMQCCRGDYILMIQDDWLCQAPKVYLRNCVRLMMAHSTIGIIGFSITLAISGKLEALAGVTERAVLYPAAVQDRDYPYLYSDQPHLRRKEVNALLGPYLEAKDMVKCEQDYERRWEEQKVFTTAMFPAYCLTAFVNAGATRSLRESRLSNRIDRQLMPVADFFRAYPAVFVGLRTLVRALQRILDR